jgi:ATP-dependent Clp protease adaptor protein ClpS
MSKGDTQTIEKPSITDKYQEPGLFKVIFVNDQTTPMDFVVQVLVEIFKHSRDKATMVMEQIHNEGSGVAGIYVYEIAEQKSVEATVLARENGYPLGIKIEPA